MKVTPGQPIPFWLRLPDNNPSAYVLAHLTSSLTGLELVGSPYPVPYSGNRGIYATPGPSMGGSVLSVDYEVYRDAGFTQIDRRYWPQQDWAEPDSGGGGSTPDPGSIVGLIEQTYLTGFLETGNTILGILDTSTTQGNLDQTPQVGVLDQGTLLEGELGD